MIKLKLITVHGFKLDADINTKKMEAVRELRRKDRLERELKEARTEVDQKILELKALQQSLDKAKTEITKLESQQKEQKIILERTLKDSDVLNARFTKLNSDFATQLMNNDALANENAHRVHELKVGHEILIFNIISI